MNSPVTSVEVGHQDAKWRNPKRSYRPLTETGAATFKTCNSSKYWEALLDSAEGQKMVLETHLIMIVTPNLPRALPTELKRRRVTMLKETTPWTASQLQIKVKTL